MEKGKFVEVLFFGEHSVRGIVEEVDRTKAMIVFGQGIWAITAPRRWIREQADELTLDLG